MSKDVFKHAIEALKNVPSWHSCPLSVFSAKNSQHEIKGFKKLQIIFLILQLDVFSK